MITNQQILFIKQYVDTKYFDVEKIIGYLKIHDIVGDEIFDISVSKNENQRKISLVESEWGYDPIQTDIFVRRIPFYYYVSDRSKGEFGSLVYLISGFSDRYGLKDWEKLYKVLERMFYHHKLSIQDIMRYISNQTGVSNRTDLFLQWGNYLDMCEKLHIDDKLPKSFIYSYNLILEKSGESPIIYEPGLVGFNENFLRNGNEIIIGGEFPCDENNNPVMKWIAIWIEDAEYIKAYDTFSMTGTKIIDKELHIGINPTTKIYMPNIYNSRDEKEDIWYPVYFGPMVMNFSSEVLRVYRNTLKYTQQKVADAIGVQVRTYQKWESGETIPDGYNLIRLMNLLNITTVQDFIETDFIIDNGFEKFINMHKNVRSKI
ncbi:MAG: helix-turn-helix transcriptional regulator [Bacilli bacterium]|nr:helix-turn-helix transcriptional regulator [Bacilli bacterium]